MADRIVKLTTAIVALLFSATAVLAQDRLTKEDLVTLAVTLGVYDNRCEKLAPRLLADLQRMVRMLDKADVMAGVVVEQEKVDEAGEAKWCGAYRPAVEKYGDPRRYSWSTTIRSSRAARSICWKTWVTRSSRRIPQNVPLKFWIRVRPSISC
jgi:hypothetical protein